MNKYVKGVLVFAGGVIGGFTICGTLVTKAVMRTESIREALKRALFDKIDFWLFGDSNQCRASRVSYRSYQKPTSYILETIVFESREEAETVLDGLLENIRTYGYTSVSDLYDLADVKNINYTNHKFGWECLNTAKIDRVRDGYILNLPKPIPIL